MLPEAGETEEIIKAHDRPVTSLETSSQQHKEDRGKAIISSEEYSVKELKNKLRLANLEIARLKKASGKHAIKEAHFDKMQFLVFHDIPHIVQPYLDDLPDHSAKRQDHPSHLRKMFLCCRHYRIQLNPHKCVFCVELGRLLGVIVS